MVVADAKEEKQRLNMLCSQLFPDRQCRFAEPEAPRVRIDSNDLPVRSRDVVLLLIFLPDAARACRLLYPPAVTRHGFASL